MNQSSARTDELGHESKSTDITTFARILEQSSLGSDSSKQSRLLGSQTLAGFRSEGIPWLDCAPSWEDVAGLQQDIAAIFDNENQAVASELWWRAAYTRSPNGVTATRLAVVLEQRRQIDEAVRWYVQAVRLGDYVAAARLAVMCENAGDLDVAHLLMAIGHMLLTQSERRRSNDLCRKLPTLGIGDGRRCIADFADTNLLYYAACRILLAGDKGSAAECLSAALLRNHKVAALTQGSMVLQAATINRRGSIDAHFIGRQLWAAVRSDPCDNVIRIDSRSAMTTRPGRSIEDLVDAAINGDRMEIERLLASIQPVVVRYCRARVGRQDRSYASADDVAQEVCLAVLTALPSYRDQRRPFLAFVYGIAAHKVAEAHRTAARSRNEPVFEFSDATELREGPGLFATNRGLSGVMAHLMSTLPSKQREILVLRVVVGLSAEETADAVGSTPGAVRVAQHRALSRLRKAFAAAIDQDELPLGGAGDPVIAGVTEHQIITTDNGLSPFLTAVPGLAPRAAQPPHSRGS